MCRNYQDALLMCNPPFGVEPDCYPSLGYYIVSSPECASSYARMWNVSDSRLANVAAAVTAIHGACSEAKTKVPPRSCPCTLGLLHIRVSLLCRRVCYFWYSCMHACRGQCCDSDSQAAHALHSASGARKPHAYGKW